MLRDADGRAVRMIGAMLDLTSRKAAEAALRRWLGMTPTFGPAVLPAGSNSYLETLMQGLCARAGVKYLGVHALRRQAGTRMYEVTGDLLETRDFLGHSTAETTEVYVEYVKRRKVPANRDW